MDVVGLVSILFTISYGTIEGANASLRRQRREDQVLLRRLEDLTNRVGNLEIELRLEKYVTRGLEMELLRLKPAAKAETVTEVTQTPDASGGSGTLPANVVQTVADITRREFTSRLDVITSGLIHEKTQTFQMAELCKTGLTKMTSRLHDFSQNFVEFGVRLDSVNQSLTRLAKRTNAGPEILNVLENKLGDVDATVNQLKSSIEWVDGTLNTFNISLTRLNATLSERKNINCSKCEADKPTTVTPTTCMTTKVRRKCPSRWVSFDGSCYYFQQSSISLTQKAASARCTSKHNGSGLVAIETRKEFDFLKQHLQNLYGTYSVRHTTSNGWLTDGLRINGDWKWETTGLSVNVSAFSWGMGRPQKLECLSLWPAYDFRVSDVSCSSFDRQYICEK